MSNPSTRLYEVGPFRFYPDERVLLCQGRNVPMPGRAKDVLFVLFEKRGEPVSKEYLLKAVWGRDGGNDSNLYRAITDCKKALRDYDPEHEYIESIREYGYHFVAEDAHEAAIEIALPPVPVASTGDSDLPTHSLHLHLASLLYGSLFGVTLIIEIAYQFDTYGRKGSILALAAAAWIYLTSVLGLLAMQRFAQRRNSASLLVGIGIFIAAAGLLLVASTWFLPPTPVTQQTTQSSTAQAAYLKHTLYHLMLVLPFLIIPFHFIVTLQQEMRDGTLDPEMLRENKWSPAPKGAVNIRPWFLLAILLVYLFYALNAHHSLSGSLKSSPFMNLFIILLWVRLALFFGLAILALIWYSRTLNDIMRNGLRLETRAIR